MVNRTKLANAIRLAALSSGAILALGQPAFAQEAGLETIEEVMVTGSRIMRANLEAPTAVTTLDSAAIEFSGQLNTADILRSLPAAGVSGLSSTNSNFFTSGGGINTIDLRNLGEERTLVLVNGRRYISGVAGTAAVDWNTIPTELIERVEVITGGASAIYGSDALAGVVNVVLKDDFEGVEVSMSHGETMEFGDDKTDRLSITMGSNFAQDKGNAVVSLTWSEEGGVWAKDRPNTETDDIAECLFSGDINDCQTSRSPFYSSYSEWGRFSTPSTPNQYVYDNGTVSAYDGSVYGFNRQAFRRHSVPTERYLISSTVNYEINDKLEAFMETTFARTETQTDIEPYPHSNGDLFINGISIDNPFVPQALRDIAIANGDDVIQYVRRTTELDNRGSFAERQTFRGVFGLRGEINDNWNWDAFYGQAQMQDSQRGTGQLNISNFRNALNAGDDGSGNIVCLDAAAVAEGCVPINIFGYGTISSAAAKYVTAPSIRDQRTRQTIAGVNIAGDLFEMPAGALAMAAGLEYRSEYAADFPDALTRTGQNAGNKEEPTEGSYSVREAYVELDAPLLTDVFLAKSLSVGAAFRISDYDTIGSTSAYTARLNWQPIDSLRVRGQYARAVRAPNINELYAPGGENFATVADPCNGVTATTPGTIADNCRSVQAIADRIASEGSFTLTQPEIQGTGGFTGKGNPNLETETSDSYTLGAVFDHDFGNIGSLTLSVDWYQIKIEDLIDTVGRQTSVDFCYNQTSFPNNFCDFVVRDTTAPSFQTGEIIEVNSGFINEGTLETSGVDVQVQWGMLLSDMFSGASGGLDFNLQYGYLNDYTLTKFGDEDESAGEVGLSKHEWLASATYSLDRFAFQWETTYVGDAVPNLDNALFNFKVGSFVTHDIYVSYNVFDSTKIYLGVDNLTDEESPIILSGVTGNTTGWDTNAAVYGNFGRSYYLGFKSTF